MEIIGGRRFESEISRREWRVFKEAELEVEMLGVDPQREESRVFVARAVGQLLSALTANLRECAQKLQPKRIRGGFTFKRLMLIIPIHGSTCRVAKGIRKNRDVARLSRYDHLVVG